MSIFVPVGYRMSGGARRDRTADLVNAIHALSQLSYGPILPACWVRRSRPSGERPL